MEKGMREPYVEGLAIRGGPESCVGDPRGRSEALTGVRAGWAIEPRNHSFGVPTPSREAEGHITGSVSASCRGTPRGLSTHACAESPCARTGRSHDCPPARKGAGRSGKAQAVRPGCTVVGSRTAPYYLRSRRTRPLAAEVVEERGLGKGNRASKTCPGHRAGARHAKCAGSCAPGRALPEPGVRPEPGAQCGSPARWDLCGGPPERAVPTATSGQSKPTPGSRWPT